MDGGKSSPQLASLDCEAITDLGKRHPVGGAARVDEQRTAMVRCPGPVLDVLKTLDDQGGPRLASRRIRVRGSQARRAGSCATLDPCRSASLPGRLRLFDAGGEIVEHVLRAAYSAPLDGGLS